MYLLTYAAGTYHMHERQIQRTQYTNVTEIHHKYKVLIAVNTAILCHVFKTRLLCVL